MRRRYRPGIYLFTFAGEDRRAARVRRDRANQPLSRWVVEEPVTAGWRPVCSYPTLREATAAVEAGR